MASQQKGAGIGFGNNITLVPNTPVENFKAVLMTRSLQLPDKVDESLQMLGLEDLGERVGQFYGPLGSPEPAFASDVLTDA